MNTDSLVHVTEAVRLSTVHETTWEEVSGGSSRPGGPSEPSDALGCRDIEAAGFFIDAFGARGYPNLDGLPLCAPSSGHRCREEIVCCCPANGDPTGDGPRGPRGSPSSRRGINERAFLCCEWLVVMET